MRNALQRTVRLGLGAALLALAGCSMIPQPTRAPTCLPTSVPIDCAPPTEQEARPPASG